MIDENWDHLRARRNNVRRYRRLLQTELTELERRYIERRLNEEKSAMESLTSSTVSLQNPRTDSQISARSSAAEKTRQREPAGFKIVRSRGSGRELIAKLRCRLAVDEFYHQSAREADVDVRLPVVLTPIVPHDRAD